MNPWKEDFYTLARNSPRLKGTSPQLLVKTFNHLSTYGYIPNTDPNHYNQLQELESTLLSALHKYQDFNVHTYNEVVNGNYEPTGRLDDTTLTVLDLPRCGCPDFPTVNSLPQLGQPDRRPPGEVLPYLPQEMPPSVAGTGSWPVGCHTPGIHEVVVYIHPSGMPTALKPIFPQVLELVKEAYRDIGMLLTFVNVPTTSTRNLPSLLSPNSIQIDFRFERLRGSTIGLAIVPSNPRCSSRIWCKYDPSYLPRNLATQWAILIAHEIGHNMRLGHSRGGIMNPSLLSFAFTKTAWRGDPSENILRRFFGIPIPDPTGTFSDLFIASNSGVYITTKQPSDQPAELTINNKTYKGKATKL